MTAPADLNLKPGYDTDNPTWPLKAEHLEVVLRRHPDYQRGRYLPAMRRLRCYIELVDGDPFPTVVADFYEATSFREHPWSMQVRTFGSGLHVDFDMPDEVADELLVTAVNEEGTW